MPTNAAQSSEPIAIIGIGCRFPGDVRGPAAFWKILRDGCDAVTEIPTDRWDILSYFDPDPNNPGKMNSRWGGFLNRIDQFDALFFGISPREAAAMDPQQRVLLEVAWEALEHAGLAAERLIGSHAGVFVGISSHDYSDLQMSDRGNNNDFDHYAMTGGALSIAASRISYFFDFRGPSMAVDTACSSALVATHLACQSLWSGESSLSLACGVNILVTPQPSIGFSKASMLSPDGRCMAFDARANGYVRGEGAGVVVLKLLSQAIADDDPIIALILGTAINQDGRTQGMTVPSRSAQEALLREACRQANISPGSVQYVEAHGTGTPVGDPIEASALGTVLSDGRAEGRYCRIGSVKTNIGHLEAASGVAGLIKVALALQHREIPRNLHFETANPRIPFDDFKLRVQQTHEAWPSDAGPAIAGVNSFGFGGTNAHVVLSEASFSRSAPKSTLSSNADRAYLFPISARSPEALNAYVRELRDFLGKSPDMSTTSLHDLCYTASARRHHHTYRHALAVESSKEFIEQLDALIARQALGSSVAPKTASRRPKLAFVFSGMGSQWWAMGRQLLKEESLFRVTIEECDALMRKHADWSLLSELTAASDKSRMTEAFIAQPAGFALQVALTRLWQAWGIEPDGIVGHSAGEVAAAHVAGALSLEDAVRVIVHRSRLQQRASGHGAMLAIGLPCSDAQRILEPYAGRACIAAINSPRSTTLAGDSEALEEIAQSLTASRVFCRFLNVAVPYHSHHMDALRLELVESLKPVQPRVPAIPLFSTVTGEAADRLKFDAGYWWRNVREPVLFSKAIDELIESGCEAFVELSAHPVLTSAVAENLANRGKRGTVLPSLRREENERVTILASLGALYVIGAPINWNGLFPERGACVPMPSYPWQWERHWSESTESERMRLGRQVHPLLGARLNTALPTWQTTLDRQRLPYLNDHRIHGDIVYPASGYVEMAVAAGKEVLGSNVVCEELEFPRALFLVDQTTMSIQLVFDERERTFNIFSRAIGAAEGWTHHATGKLRELRNGTPAKIAALSEIRSRCANELSKTDCYANLKRMGLHYGPCHQGIERLWIGDGEALGEILVPDMLVQACQAYHLHPAVLDACCQVLSGAVRSTRLSFDDRGMYVPVGIERVRIFRAHGRRLSSHAKLLAWDTNGFEGQIVLFDEAGNVIAEVQRLRCQRVQNKSDKESRQLYEAQWHPKPLQGRDAARPHVDFIAPLNRIADELRIEATKLGEEHERDRYYDVVARRLDALAVAYVVEAFRQLGWQFISDEQLSANSLMVRFGIAPQYEKLLCRMLEMLEEHGILEKAGSAYVACRRNDSTDCERSRLALLEQHPEYHCELEILGRCGSNLADILRGQCDALQLIFPQDTSEKIEQFYRESPAALIYNLLARSAVAAALEHLPKGQTVRILEIGAGTGGMTSHVVSALAADRVEYFFTDVSSRFTAAAKRQFHNYPFVQFRSLDIELDPRDQGFASQSFDLILASEVLHATKNLGRTLENVKKLLSSNGLLLLIELSKTPCWIELIFGLLKSWWLFEDADTRPSRPWISSRQWVELLIRHGFSEVVDVCEVRRERDSLQALILARGPRFEAPVRATNVIPNVPMESGSWLILADGGGLGRRLGQYLRSRGERVVMAYAGDGPHKIDEDEFQVEAESARLLQQLVETVAGTHSNWRGIVHLWTLDGPPVENMTTADLVAAQVLGCESIIHIVQALGKQADIWAQPTLKLVTRGAQVVGSNGFVVVPTQSPLWGVGRVAANEIRSLRCTMIDLDPAGGSDDAKQLFAELWSDDQEDAIAFRSGQRYVNRLVRLLTTPAAQEQESGIGVREHGFRLEVARPGVLDSLLLREFARSKPDSSAVEIQVKAIGLNFRDVMKALGMYLSDPGESTWLGGECAGRIVAVGEDVKEFKVGDDVICISSACFGAYVTAPSAFVVRKPDHMTYDEAATIPIAFLTSHFALHHLAKISAGERILIHAGAGGVGMAAIQLAQQVGAEVFATVGSQEKRDALRSLGVDHIMNSRSLDFADEVMEMTNGEGVDIVLNSLAGDAIAKSLSVLRAHGRFIEIGKRDIYQNSKLGLRPFRQNVSFFAVDLSKASQTRPAVVSSIFSQLMHDFETGALRALPHRIYPMRNVVDAFRCMAQAKHIGKIVVSLVDGERLPIAPMRYQQSLFKREATYLITGGCGGFGLAIAQWMVDQGARHLALIGRRGVPSAEAEAAIEGLRRAGCQVLVAKVDVGREEQLAELFATIGDAMPSLRGIVHAAMVLDDGFVIQQTTERMRSVMAPKMCGAWNLHRLTLDMQLDFFVLFSSFTSMVGNPGQANYAAANSFLDALAHYRRAKGLPALTVNWGAVSEVGYVARHGELGRHLERMGIGAFTSEEATTILESLLRAKCTQIGAASVDWRKIFEAVPQIASSPQFTWLVQEVSLSADASAPKGTFLKSLLVTQSDQRAKVLDEFLREQIARVSGAPASKLNFDLSVADLGIDSLMAVELETVVQAELGINLPVGFLLDRRVAISELGKQILDRLFSEPPDTTLAMRAAAKLASHDGHPA